MSHLAMAGTFSKSPRAWGLDDNLRVVAGDGANIYFNGNETASYLDWVCGLGSNILGYSQLDYIEATTNQVWNGAGFSLPHYLEDEVADLLVEKVASKIPNWDKNDILVRFGKSGSDGTAMSVRLARAFTGKDVIFSCGYHGWNSEFIAADLPAHGIPLDYKRSIQKFNFNDFNSVYKLDDRRVAAIIIEQGIDDPNQEWYPFLREYCDNNQCLLIMDEVVTGLRYGMGGACERYNITPDIVVMGKALANGMAVSAVMARSEIMNWFTRSDPAFVSSTHFGEAVSLAAAKYVLENWNRAKIAHLKEIGMSLMIGMRTAGWNIIGHPERSLLLFEDDYQRAFFIKSMFSKHILMNRPNFPNMAHRSEDVAETIYAASETKQEWDKYGRNREVREILSRSLPHVLFKSR